MALTSVCWRTLWEKDCAVKIFSMPGRTVFPFIFPKIYCANLCQKWLSNTMDHSLKSIFFLCFNLRRYTCFCRFLYNFVSFFKCSFWYSLDIDETSVYSLFIAKEIRSLYSYVSPGGWKVLLGIPACIEQPLLSTAFFVVILVRVLGFCIAVYWEVQSLYKVFSLKVWMQIMPYFPLKLYISITSCTVAQGSPH